MECNQLAQLFRRSPKCITGLTLVSFFTLVFLGIFDCANPMMQRQMTMDGQHSSTVDCIPGKNCGMDINEHISIWQGMFLTNITMDIFSFLTLVLVVGLAFVHCKFLSSLDFFPLASRYLHYDREHPEHKLYHYLLRIFSDGILQPKLFAS